VYPDGTNKKIPDERDIPSGGGGGGGGGTSEFPPGTILYFYQASPPPGWEIVGGVGDCVLAVQGGSTYLTAGTITGIWNLSVSGTANGTIDLAIDPNLPRHKHSLGLPGLPWNALLVYEPNNQQYDLPVYPGGSLSTRIPIKLFVPPQDSGEAGSEQGHSHYAKLNLTASTNTWRPRAAVGILARKL
jgi:hypothetical protein